MNAQDIMVDDAFYEVKNSPPITGRGSTRWLVAAVALLAVSGITWLLEFWIQQGTAGVLPDSRTCSGSLYGYNLTEEMCKK